MNELFKVYSIKSLDTSKIAYSCISGSKVFPPYYHHAYYRHPLLGTMVFYTKLKALRHLKPRKQRLIYKYYNEKYPY